MVLNLLANVLGESVGPHGGDRLGRDHIENVEPDLVGGKGIDDLGLFGTAHTRDDHGHFGALGDLEAAGMEGEKLSGFASGAFRIDADAAEMARKPAPYSVLPTIGIDMFSGLEINETLKSRSLSITIIGSKIEQ